VISKDTSSVKSVQIVTFLLFTWTGLYALFFLYHGVRLLIFPFDIDNSEGYLLHQGMRLARGEFLYPPINDFPYTVDNYPPLYPLLLALGYVFTGVNFFWARFISFGATLLTAIVSGFWTWHYTRDKSASVLASLAYLSFYHVYDWGALARVDALGVFLTIFALYWFESKRTWLVPMLFCLLALYTRQTLFAAPLAILCVLHEKDRRQAYTFTGALLGTGFILFLFMLLLSSGRAFSHLVLYNANEFRLSDVWIYVRHWIFLYPVWGAVPLLILCWGKQVIYSPTGERLHLLFWYTLFAIFEALLCGKIGSAPNYLLSLVCATSVGLGLLFSLFRRTLPALLGDSSAIRYVPILVFLLASLLQMFNAWHIPHYRDWAITPTREMAEQATRVRLHLERVEGLVFSDRSGIDLMAGHEPVYQPFIFTQLARQEMWEQEQILKRVREREFARVLLHFDLNDPNWDRERFTPALIDALRQNYALQQQTGSYYLYQPNTVQSPQIQ
jgi:hypothetical protein